jgi:hypothetical protein
MKSIFKKRDSKATRHESRSHKEPLTPAVASERIQDYSHKSPRLISDKFAYLALGNNMPNIPIPEPPDPTSKPGAYLRSIHAVRQRTRLVLDEAKSNALYHFDVDMSKFKNTADYVVSIIKVGRARNSGQFDRLTTPSEISMKTTHQYHLMVAGSILKSEAGLE